MIVGEASVPAGHRVYAIGDVHGCFSQLKSLVRAIEADIATDQPGLYEIIFLGDYCDRGAQSAATLDFLVEMNEADNVTCLRGNHDDRFLNFITDPASNKDVFLRWGGEETVLSYGLALNDCSKIANKVPEAHGAFLDSLELSYSVGDYYFCHAGVDPQKNLDEQAPSALMWIRDDFLSHQAPFEKVIVHGHTPQVGIPDVKSNRINIDTCCYATGILTALVLESDRQRFLQVTGPVTWGQ